MQFEIKWNTSPTIGPVEQLPGVVEVGPAVIMDNNKITVNGVRVDPKPLTHAQRIMLLLSQGRWVSARELNAIAFRYTARLHELKKRGFAWEIKRDESGLTWYKAKP